jgi:hypothetical protein
VKALPFIVVAGLAWSWLGPAAAAAPGWSVYADCAAAYLANARVPDPDRPAAMIAQVSDVANDYAAAARARYRPTKRASAAVQARIHRRTTIYAGQPREAVERVIDACPQVGG